MSLLNNNFISFDGTPVTGRVPTQVQVYADEGYQMSDQLRAAVAHAYKMFCDSVAVSANPKGYHLQNRNFSDGSKCRMESNNGVHRVMVWPVGSGDEPKTFLTMQLWRTTDSYYETGAAREFPAWKERYAPGSRTYMIRCSSPVYTPDGKDSGDAIVGIDYELDDGYGTVSATWLVTSSKKYRLEQLGVVGAFQRGGKTLAATYDYDSKTLRLLRVSSGTGAYAETVVLCTYTFLDTNEYKYLGVHFSDTGLEAFCRIRDGGIVRFTAVVSSGEIAAFSAEKILGSTGDVSLLLPSYLVSNGSVSGSATSSYPIGFSEFGEYTSESSASGSYAVTLDSESYQQVTSTYTSTVTTTFLGLAMTSTFSGSHYVYRKSGQIFNGISTYHREGLVAFERHSQLAIVRVDDFQLEKSGAYLMTHAFPTNTKTKVKVFRLNKDASGTWVEPSLLLESSAQDTTLTKYVYVNEDVVRATAREHYLTTIYSGETNAPIETRYGLGEYGYMAPYPSTLSGSEDRILLPIADSHAASNVLSFSSKPMAFGTGHDAPPASPTYPIRARTMADIFRMPIKPINFSELDLA